MSSELRVGVLILQTDPWPNIVERVQSYEALGLDSIHVANHFVHYGDPAGPWFECWTLLAGLALQTSRIRLGPLVSHPIFRNPALLARQAMTLDHLSGGRLELGLGTGASDYDWTMTGGSEPWPFAERVERFHEMIEIVDRLLRDGAASYQGHHYRIADATLHPGPVQRPRPADYRRQRGEDGQARGALRRGLDFRGQLPRAVAGAGNSCGCAAAHARAE